MPYLNGHFCDLRQECDICLPWLTEQCLANSPNLINFHIFIFFLINIPFFMSLSSESRLFTESMLSWPLILSRFRIISSLNQTLIVWMLHLYCTWYPWNYVKGPERWLKHFSTMSHVPYSTHVLYFEEVLLSFSKLLRCFPFNSCILDMRKKRNSHLEKSGEEITYLGPLLKLAK